MRFARFDRRSLELERLDVGDYTETEYRRWEIEMRYLHRIFGEIRALKRTLVRDLRTSTASSVSILDVGAGSGELIRQIQELTKPRKLFFTGLELNEEATRSIKNKGIAAVRADALNLPFADGSYDHVFCTLFLHHLDDISAIALIKEMRRVADGRIYAVDLDRQPIPYYLYKIVGPVFLQRFTIQDGLVSILRSRSPEELREIAQKAGLTDIQIDRSRANRLILSGN